MSTSFNKQRPVLVINDSTGAFVMTEQLAACVGYAGGSLLYLRGQQKTLLSPLTPQQLRTRMFDMNWPPDED